MVLCLFFIYYYFFPLKSNEMLHVEATCKISSTIQILLHIFTLFSSWLYVYSSIYPWFPVKVFEIPGVQ